MNIITDDNITKILGIEPAYSSGTVTLNSKLRKETTEVAVAEFTFTSI